MNSQLLTRRGFSRSLTSVLSGLGLSTSALASSTGPRNDEISRTEEAIHQEVVLKASRKRVYDALTETEQFRKATGVEGTKISREVGGAFSLFAGAIEGRHVEPGAGGTHCSGLARQRLGKRQVFHRKIRDQG